MASHGTEHADDQGGDFGDPEAGSTWIWSLGGAIVFTALVLVIAVFYFRAEVKEFDEKVVDEPSAEYQALKAKQLANISDYGTYTVTTADGAEQRRIRVPVSRAMEVVVADGGAAFAPVAPAAAPAAASVPAAAPAPAASAPAGSPK
jgi:hypothetical protein